ncbi:uncharacterized protein FA14DRAFT_138405 [Meira miltonrushii]|uniref:BAG domain-containing protein n=1 Tax=Meira miltonrushii TaxID=1280837 RepID=A0A316V620_9BASI|nr:uncharacterized protein FA14DRAFT_138405 [Meira miltonrushii]PWN31921.1 hypothetical protein FA14DRAFT_138405 [Meira miltonrushii]
MSWFSQQWNKLTGQPDEEVGMPIKRVEVIWGRERLMIPVDEQLPNQATLRNLKESISHFTSIPYEQVKLIMGGLVLKDERAPLSAFGIRTGSRLQLIGTSGGVPIQGDRPGAKQSVFDEGSSGGAGKMSKGEELARRKKEREEDVSEQGLLTRINETVTDVRKDLLPEVLEFEQSPKEAHSPAMATTSSPAELASRQEALTKQHKKLSELLLRALLALDGVNVNSEETRKRRKEAVKEVQGYLDRVDATWSQLKEQFSSASKSPNGKAALA